MSKDAIEHLFKPESVALFGASERPGSLGSVLLSNLTGAGFPGDIVLVNPKYDTLAGQPCYPSLKAADREVDLAIIVAPAETVPDIIADCGEQGVDAAIVLSAGFGEAGGTGRHLERELLTRARSYGVRVLGPNCLGIINTASRLNATFSSGNARPGRISIISQSGALCSAILDWANEGDVGFSNLVSMGIGVDVCFGEVLDFLVQDRDTDSIMLYIEGIRGARRFLSALRAAARVKPVVVMKSGRHPAGMQAAVSHTGAIVGADEVFDAALKRAGVLRVRDFPDFFATAKNLDSGVRTGGNRLTIVTNAGGPGVMAADHAADRGLPLARLSDASIATLDEVLPRGWSRGNPVDVLGDATPERYETAIRACLDDHQTDALLVILTPQALTDPEEVAKRLCAIYEDARKPVFACWMGGVSVASSHELFSTHDLTSFRTPEAAVAGFAAIAAYRENQAQLLEVPDPLSEQANPDLSNARLIIDDALAQHRSVLDIAESKGVLAAFHLPVLSSIPAGNVQDAISVAQVVGYPVAMKIDSPDITHKSDVGGVRLGIADAHGVRRGFEELVAKVRSSAPEAQIDGVVIEPMWRGEHPRELMVGVVRDPVFGPAVSVGLGGTMVEILKDSAVALPPLNRVLVRDLIDRSRVAGVLGPLRGAPAADREAFENLVLRVSEMVCELPAIREMDLNPVVADETGVTVVDARIVVAPPNPAARPYDHMAIHPYPRNLVKTVELGGVQVTIRPIRPEDAVIEREFVDQLSQRSRYYRFMYSLAKITPEMLSRFTQIDYDREMAFIATVRENGRERQIGVTRYALMQDPTLCEFAIVVADDWQRRGLARALLVALINAARYRGCRRMLGDVLTENEGMRAFVKSMGFVESGNGDDPEVVRVSLEL